MAQRYTLSTGCYEIDLKVFPPTPSVSGAVQAFTALRKVHYHHSTTLPAQEEDQRALTGERKPLSDFTVAVGQSLLMAHRR